MYAKFIANGFRFSLNAAAELGFWTPDEVAEVTVDGILKNRKYVSIPCYMTKSIQLLQYVFNLHRNRYSSVQFYY